MFPYVDYSETVNMLFICFFQAKTTLGADLTSVDLNESNISEILRLFILSRNDGKFHILSDCLTKYPIEALSPNNKAAVLAFIVNELLCGKAIGRYVLANRQLKKLNKFFL